MPTNPVLFVSNGMAPGLAREVARQLDSLLTPSPSYMMGVGMPAALAGELCAQIAAGLPNVRNLMGLGMPVELANAVGSAVTAASLKLVGTTGVAPNNTFDVTGTGRTNFLVRIPVYIGRDCPAIVLAFDNWYIGAFGVLTQPTQALTLIGAALESENLTSTKPITFSGASGITLAVGAVDIHSDELAASAFGLTKFTRNEKYYVRLCGSIATEGEFIQGPAPTQSLYYDPALNVGASAKVYLTGAYTGLTDADTDIYGYGPTAVLGVPSAAGLSVAAMGDSLTYSNADTTSLVPTGRAHFSRAAMADGVATGIIAQSKFARGGATCANMVLNQNIWRYFRYLNALDTFLVTNDIGATGTGNVATAYSNCLTIWTAARARAVQKIMATKLWPRTDSVDGWTTTVGQTCLPGWGAGEKSSQFNALLDAAVSSRTIDVAFNQTSWRDPADALKWIPNGSMTDDTHPPTAGHTAIGAELRTALQALSVT